MSSRSKRKGKTNSPLPPSKKNRGNPEGSDDEGSKDQTTVFKDPNYKRKRDKPLKQIISQERNASFAPECALYFNIDAPPSLKPPHKYSDSTGLMAYYTDPRTRIRYNNKVEYSEIALMTDDVIKAYLALRNEAADLHL
eukprot:CFRG0464T1